MTEEARIVEPPSEAKTLRDTPEAELRERVFKVAKQRAAAWKRGMAKGDGEGKAAAKLAAETLVKGKLPKKPSVDDAARLLSLMGATDSEQVEPLGELFIREHGLAFAVEVVARMWSHKSASHNPDWPKSEKRAAYYITAIDDDDDSVHDASCSYSKSTFTLYLEHRYRAGTAAERTQMRKAVTAIWKSTTPHARPALAYLTRDEKRAKESAEELIHAGESPWPYWAWDHLPYVLTDAELVIRILDDRPLSVDLIRNLGTAIWDVYAERVGGHMDSMSRAHYLSELSNFYGPKTAMIFAEYEDNKECADYVASYFERYPELLDKVIDEPSLAYHREDLEKLRAKISDKLARDRPQRSRSSSQLGTSSPSSSASRTS